MSRTFLDIDSLIFLWQKINNQLKKDFYKKSTFPDIYHLKQNDFEQNTSLLNSLFDFYGEHVTFYIDKENAEGQNIELVTDDQFMINLANSLEKNYKNKLPLFHNVRSQKMYHPYYSRAISIMCDEQENTSGKMKEWLALYIKDFENGDLYLEDKVLYSMERHFKRFMGLIAELLQRANPKNIPVNIGIEVGDFDYKYRDLEYILLLDKKGFIKLKELKKIDSNSIFIRIDILKEFKEMQDLYYNWLTFGNLSFRPDSGHAYNGNVLKIFQLYQPAYNTLKLFMENPEKKFSMEDIEEIAFGDKSIDEKQRKTRIHDLISKQVRKPLKMAEKESRVNILSTGNYFFLSAIPSRI